MLWNFEGWEGRLPRSFLLTATVVLIHYDANLSQEHLKILQNSFSGDDFFFEPDEMLLVVVMVNRHLHRRLAGYEMPDRLRHLEFINTPEYKSTTSTTSTPTTIEEYSSHSDVYQRSIIPSHVGFHVPFESNRTVSRHPLPAYCLCLCP
jgi:hypothetical protein